MKRMSILSALVLLGVGCDAVLGIEAGVAAPECKRNEDCVKKLGADPDCALPVCENGSCQANFALEGAAVSAGRQVPNDCQRLMCDGHGGVRQEALDDADDGNPCTEEHCKDGAVQTPVKLNGTAQACYTGPEGTRGVGSCHEGTIGCNDGVATGECVGQVLPKTEVCLDGADEDCDGNPDEAYDGCICGDGSLTPEMGEQCDDGGQADGDDCSPTCKEQRVLQIEGGAGHFCALLSGGVMKCWGRDAFGELGIASSENVGDEGGEMGAGLEAIDFGGRKVASINADEASSCAVFEDGGAKCWGVQRHGALGQPGLSNNWMGSPKDLPDIALGGAVKKISGAADHKCALLQNGTVKCWGLNVYGALGIADGDFADHEVPSKAIDFAGESVKQIVTGALHTCALLEAGDVKCWGASNRGQTGRGTTVAYGAAVGQMGADLKAIPLKAPAIEIAAADNHSCALLANYEVKCWGSNSYGQLGLGNTDDQGDQAGEVEALEPIDLGLADGTHATHIRAFYGMSCAVISDGSLRCWGLNVFNNYYAPAPPLNNAGDEPGEMGLWLKRIDFGPEYGIEYVAYTYPAICVLLSTGNVKCWGRNIVGILGQEKPDQAFAIPEPAAGMGDVLPKVKLFSNFW